MSEIDVIDETFANTLVRSEELELVSAFEQQVRDMARDVVAITIEDARRAALEEKDADSAGFHTMVVKQTA